MREGTVWKEAMEVIVVRALTKIAQDCPRKHSVLKKACKETLGENNQTEQYLLPNLCAAQTVRHDSQHTCRQCTGLPVSE